MLTSDGLSREQFLPLWRDAMWHAVDPEERTRLLLELGRLTVKEERQAAPLLVTWTEGVDEPMTILPLTDVPCARTAPAVRAAALDKIAEVAASEVYLLFTLRGAAHEEGPPSFVLAAWGETRGGDACCTVLAYRWIEVGVVEEAQRLIVPSPRESPLGLRVAGLLRPLH